MTAAEISANLKKAGSNERRGANKGLFLAAEHVLQVSNTRVPIEEGTLERSGATSVDPAQLKASVAYDTPYAVSQHENLTYHHDAGRSAKYLESAVTGERDTIRKLIAAEIRKAIGT